MTTDQPLHTITSPPPPPPPASQPLRPHWSLNTPETLGLPAGWRWELSCCRSRRIDWLVVWWCVIQCQSVSQATIDRQSHLTVRMSWTAQRQTGQLLYPAVQSSPVEFT